MDDSSTSRRAARVLLAVLALAVGCGSSEGEGSVDAAPEPLFSLAVITDPHITGDPDHETRLADIIDTINAEAAARKIELVLVLGDIGWSGELGTAKGLLDGLTVPYVPLIGDNEIHAGAEHVYDTTFTPQFDLLAGELENWEKQPMPVHEPVSDDNAWLQNFSFDYRGLHFIAADWCARGIGDWDGELGYLHDFEGGTWPWFQDAIEASAGGTENRVIILSHIPMQKGTFEPETMETIKALIAPQKDYVYADLAGHTHLSYDVSIDELFQVYVTAATWNDDDPLRVIGVAQSGDSFVYTHELIYVPF